MRASTSSTLNGSITTERFAAGLRTALTGLIVSSALAHRMRADGLQHRKRLANGGGPNPVGFKRLAERLHGRCRELAELEVPNARHQVAIPDLRVGVERVAREPPAGVVRPPVVLDKLAQDNAATAQLVQRPSPPREAKVRLVVERIVDGVELLASPAHR
ncbi:MAG TPA: hypothetical protein VF080_04795 [Solirubrobacteraceae bacterium]